MEVSRIHNRGNHLMLDGFECQSNELDSVDYVRDALVRIANITGLSMISEPLVVYHKSKKPEESGVTGVVIIAESHVSIHTYPEKKYVAVDVFSCREFDVDKVRNFVVKSFGARRVEASLADRGFTREADYKKELPAVKGDVGKLLRNDFAGHSKSLGFQATNLGIAVDIIRRMKKDKATIFLTFTSNMVSSGLREIFAYLVRNRLVDVIVTSVGSIEEDLMKSKRPFLLGSFDMSDIELHKRGINRIGNIFVPNKNYEELEDMLMPFFAQLLKKQKDTGKMISPRELIHELGKTINDKNSILCWASKNSIPIFCPAITDGALGLNLYFFKQKHPEFGIDVTADMNEIAKIVLNSGKAGGIILGGGVAKHYTIGVNILREGLDYGVYVTTAGEGDGSLSGARPKEAKSWGKLKEEANSVTVEGDATIIFPLIVASAFKK